MAIAVQMDFAGASTDQYDQVVKKMGLTPGGPGPSGAISHFVTMTADGMRVVDVWESKEQFDQFAQEKIGPLAESAGFPGPPQITFFEIHNYLTPG